MHARILLSLLVLGGIALDLPAQRRRPPTGRPAPAAPDNQPAPPPAASLDRSKVKAWTLYKGADLHLGTGEVLRRGELLVGDDKIFAIGTGLDLPEGGKVIECAGRVISPGFVAVRALGLGQPSGNPGKAADGVNPFDPTIKMALAAGITSYGAIFEGGTASPDGRSAVLKLAFGDLKGMVLQEDSVLQMRVPLNPQQWQTLRDQVKKVQDHKKAVAEHAAKKDNTPAPKPPAGTEKLLRVIDREARLWIGAAGAYDNDAIREALEVARLLDVGVVLVEPLTAWSIPDEVAATGSMAIVNPRQVAEPDPGRKDSTGSNLAQCRILNETGVAVAVTTPRGGFAGGPSIGTGGIMGQDLNTPHIDAAFAVRGGMDNREALRTLTLDAARILGAESRIGSLEVGKDADLLILDGDPLHYRTFVQIAVVNGKVVYEKDKEPFYSHIGR